MNSAKLTIMRSRLRSNTAKKLVYQPVGDVFDPSDDGCVYRQVWLNLVPGVHLPKGATHLRDLKPEYRPYVQHFLKQAAALAAEPDGKGVSALRELPANATACKQPMPPPLVNQKTSPAGRRAKVVLETLLDPTGKEVAGYRLQVLVPSVPLPTTRRNEAAAATAPGAAGAPRVPPTAATRRQSSSHTRAATSPSEQLRRAAGIDLDPILEAGDEDSVNLEDGSDDEDDELVNLFASAATLDPRQPPAVALLPTGRGRRGNKGGSGDEEASDSLSPSSSSMSEAEEVSEAEAERTLVTSATGKKKKKKAAAAAQRKNQHDQHASEAAAREANVAKSILSEAARAIDHDIRHLSMWRAHALHARHKRTDVARKKNATASRKRTLAMASAMGFNETIMSSALDSENNTIDNDRIDMRPPLVYEYLGDSTYASARARRGADWFAIETRNYFHPPRRALSATDPGLSTMISTPEALNGHVWVDPRRAIVEAVTGVPSDTALNDVRHTDGIAPDVLLTPEAAMCTYVGPLSAYAPQCDPRVYFPRLYADRAGVPDTRQIFERAYRQATAAADVAASDDSEEDEADDGSLDLSTDGLANIEAAQARSSTYAPIVPLVDEQLAVEVAHRFERLYAHVPAEPCARPAPAWPRPEVAFLLAPQFVHPEFLLYMPLPFAVGDVLPTNLRPETLFQLPAGQMVEWIAATETIKFFEQQVGGSGAPDFTQPDTPLYTSIYEECVKNIRHPSGTEYYACLRNEESLVASGLQQFAAQAASAGNVDLLLMTPDATEMFYEQRRGTHMACESLDWLVERNLRHMQSAVYANYALNGERVIDFAVDSFVEGIPGRLERAVRVANGDDAMDVDGDDPRDGISVTPAMKARWKAEVAESLDYIHPQFLDMDVMLKDRMGNTGFFAAMKLEYRYVSEVLMRRYANDPQRGREKLATLSRSFRRALSEEHIAACAKVLKIMLNDSEMNVGKGYIIMRPWLKKHACENAAKQPGQSNVYTSFLDTMNETPYTQFAAFGNDTIVSAYRVTMQTFVILVCIIICGKHAYRHELNRSTPALNAIIAGSGNFGKSFILNVLALIMLAAMKITDTTMKALQTRVNSDGVVRISEEMDLVPASASRRGGSTEGDPAHSYRVNKMKNRLTSFHEIVTYFHKDDETGERQQRECYASYHCVEIGATNQDLSKLDKQLRRRFQIFMAPKSHIDDPGCRAADRDIRYQSMGNQKLSHRLQHYHRLIDAMYATIEAFIKAGALPDVLMDAARMHMAPMLRVLETERHVKIDKDRQDFLLEATRVRTIMYAAHMALFSNTARCYHEQEGAAPRWSARAIYLLATPYLYASKQQLLDATSTFIHLYMPEHHERALYLIAAKALHVHDSHQWKFRRTDYWSDNNYGGGGGGRGGMNDNGVPTYDYAYLVVERAQKGELLRYLSNLNRDYQLREEEMEAIICDLKAGTVFTPEYEPVDATNVVLDDRDYAEGRRPVALRRSQRPDTFAEDQPVAYFGYAPGSKKSRYQLAIHVAFLETHFGFTMSDPADTRRAFRDTRDSLVRKMDLTDAEQCSDALVDELATISFERSPLMAVIKRTFETRTLERSPYEVKCDVPVPPAAYRYFVQHAVQAVQIQVHESELAAARERDPDAMIREKRTVLMPGTTLLLELKRNPARRPPRVENHAHVSVNVARYANVFYRTTDEDNGEGDNGGSDENGVRQRHHDRSEAFNNAIGFESIEYDIDYLYAVEQLRRIAHPGLPFVEDALVAQFSELAAKRGEAYSEPFVAFNFRPMTYYAERALSQTPADELPSYPHADIRNELQHGARMLRSELDDTLPRPNDTYRTPGFLNVAEVLDDDMFGDVSFRFHVPGERSAIIPVNGRDDGHDGNARPRRRARRDEDAMDIDFLA